MRKTRSLFVLVLTVLLAVMLAMSGCSSGTNKESASGSGDVKSGDGKESPSSTSTPNKPILGASLKYDPNQEVNGGKQITLNVWVADQYDRFKSWADDYTQIHPNVKLELVKSPWGDYWKKLPLSLQSGVGPDVFYQHPSYVLTMVDFMEPMPESVFPSNEIEADFTNIVKTQDGKLYGLPLAVTTSGIYYNKKMWAEAGLTETDIPKTWDQLIDAAKKLTKLDKKGNMTVMGFSANGEYHDMLNAMNFEKGNFLFDSSGTKVSLNNDTVKDALKFYKDLSSVHKVTEPRQDSDEDEFGKGSAAMVYNYNWAGEYFNSTYPDIEWGYFALPTFDGATPPAYDKNMLEFTPGVNKVIDDTKKAVAWDFIKFIAADDTQVMKQVKEASGIPAKKSLMNDPFVVDNPILKVQKDTIPRTLNYGFIPQSAINKIVTKMIEDVLFNAVPISDAVVTAETNINKSFESAGLKFKSMERSYPFANEFKNQ
ncbi:extracellular solute-binding protein [Cohnella pontilimi]|uniref:Extracellular solute-binding protein n=1 Tax=Cohnella pontilimi TaxID=2564100 RepID=A0A4U0FGC2_9BACL|nr:extracellular solute-binding protein [Cohnella pontilimi]TJY42422.1 extracellular solute-binding protein [Cohnella pontilimi]